MFQLLSILTLLLTFTSLGLGQALTIIPTTTLDAETSNNTSAPDTFTGWTNGNIGAANVSKVSIKTLLPPGSKVPVYVHLVGWWGPGSNGVRDTFGYSNLDPAHAKRMADDLVSRGVDGILLNWEGKGSFSDQTLAVMMPYLQANHLKLILFASGGILSNGHTCYPKCSGTQAITDSISYFESLYKSSPTNVHLPDGRMLVVEFGLGSDKVDFNALQTAHPEIAILHQGNGGYTKLKSEGSYFWISTIAGINPTYDGTVDLAKFYVSAAHKQSTQMTFGSIYKGFDDSMATWAPVGGRHIAQLCGQTWLKSWALANSNAANLGGLQVVTWDDYEEGTATESGVDNCLSVTANIDANKTVGSILVGEANTLDHIEVFISQDGNNLMKLSDVAVNARLPLPVLVPGAYQVYTKAVGKPFIVNHMSAPVAYNVSGQPPVQPLVPLQYEVETLNGKSSGPTLRTLFWSGFPDGKGMILGSTKLGDSVTYTVNVSNAGTYDLHVSSKNYKNRGIWQLSIDGANVATRQDEYNSVATFADVDLGLILFKAPGNHTFRFVVTGKNANSNGFSVSFDSLKLIRR